MIQEKTFALTIDRTKSISEITAEITRQTGYSNILARIAAAEIKYKGYYACNIDGIRTKFIVEDE